MRIPRQKLYRAFPELDRFTDEQCERFMQRARIRSSYSPTIGVTVLATVIAALMMSIMLLRHIHEPVNSWFAGLLGVRTAETIVLGAYMIIVLAAPAFCGLLARDIVLRLYLRRAMQSQIERIRCPSCKYVLLGQRVSGGAVICPECGARTTLMHLGITEADLIPPTDGSEPVVDT